MKTEKSFVRIGVLGGIGPEATGLFYNRLIKRLQQKRMIKDNTDYPKIIINSIPAPELIYDKISDEDLEDYVDGLKELDSFGVDFIVMVCNTIHLFYERLQNGISAPVMDLRKAVHKELKKNNIKTATILGTPGTVENGLYKFHGIKYLNPSAKETKQLSDAIFNFNRGVKRNKQVEVARKICQKYLQRGSQRIVLACTEFAVMLPGQMPKIDTIDVMVDMTIENILKLNKQN